MCNGEGVKRAVDATQPRRHCQKKRDRKCLESHQLSGRATSFTAAQPLASHCFFKAELT